MIKIIEAKNYTKIRVLWYLKAVAPVAVESTELEPNGTGEVYAWRAPVHIARDTGVKAASLYIILKRWRSNHWGYADAKYFDAVQMADARPHWLYRINSRGFSYLERLPKRYEVGVLAKMRASLAEYQEASCCDFLQWKLVPRCIAWRVKPSEYFTLMEWPFKSKSDASEAKWSMNGFEVADIQAAAHMAEIQFDIKPSKECLSYAKAVEEFWVKKALDKLAAGAGVATTR